MDTMDLFTENVQKKLRHRHIFNGNCKVSAHDITSQVKMANDINSYFRSFIYLFDCIKTLIENSAAMSDDIENYFDEIDDWIEYFQDHVNAELANIKDSIKDIEESSKKEEDDDDALSKEEIKEIREYLELIKSNYNKQNENEKATIEIPSQEDIKVAESPKNKIAKMVYRVVVERRSKKFIYENLKTSSGNTNTTEDFQYVVKIPEYYNDNFVVYGDTIGNVLNAASEWLRNDIANCIKHSDENNEKISYILNNYRNPLTRKGIRKPKYTIDVDINEFYNDIAPSLIGKFIETINK